DQSLTPDSGSDNRADSPDRSIRSAEDRSAEEQWEKLVFEASRLSGESDLSSRADAEEKLLEAHQVARELFSAQDIRRIKPLLGLGTLYQETSQPLKALESLRRAHAALRSRTDQDLEMLSTVNHNLGRLYDQLGKHSKAQAHYHEAIFAAESRRMPDQETLASIQNNLAVSLMRELKFGDALEPLDASVKIREALLADNSQNQELRERLLPELTESYVNIAYAHFFSDRAAQAQRYAHKARALGSSGTPKGDLAQAALESLEATFKASSGDYSGAIGTMQRAYQLSRSALDPEDPSLMRYSIKLASMYLQSGREDDAFELLSPLRERYSESLGEYHHDYARVLVLLGNIAVFRDQPSEAKQLFLQGLERISSEFGEKHKYARNTLRDIVNFLEDCGQSEMANAFRGRISGDSMH
ncbi:MAG: tetratricopeptide repeat protein, partial [Bdellovibrionales bacterium]|nr:tetratricopeptide repeat protein [Bdellovibrionales bacterium]